MATDGEADGVLGFPNPGIICIEKLAENDIRIDFLDSRLSGRKFFALFPKEYFPSSRVGGHV